MKKVLVILLSILLICTVCFTSYADPIPPVDITPSDGNGRYEAYFIDYLGYSEESNYKYCYEEIYEYTSSKDEENFVLIKCYRNYAIPADQYIVIDDYVIETEHSYIPYRIGLFVFLTSEQKILTLDEAKNAGVAGLENIFTETNIGRKIGDVNNDKIINIKDATCIQKLLAKIIDIDDVYLDDGDIAGYYSDFNRDGLRNIKDATAIQKYIAKIDV